MNESLCCLFRPIRCTPVLSSRMRLVCVRCSHPRSVTSFHRLDEIPSSVKRNEREIIEGFMNIKVFIFMYFYVFYALKNNKNSFSYGIPVENRKMTVVKMKTICMINVTRVTVALHALEPNAQFYCSFVLKHFHTNVPCSEPSLPPVKLIL